MNDGSKKNDVSSEKINAGIEVKIAKITIAGTIVAAVISGIFLLIAEKNKNPEVIQVNIVPLEQENTVESKKPQSLNQLREMYDMDIRNSYARGKPSLASFPVDNELQIRYHGSVDGKLGFSLVSPPSKTITIEKFYLKIDAWASCDLRNEFYSSQGLRTPLSKSFYISDNYNIYPISIYNSAHTEDRLYYIGRDIDSFDLYLESDPYKVFFVSVVVEYKDDVASEKNKVINLKPTPIISVLKGNDGGCLDLENWWTPELNLNPKVASYAQQIPEKIYSFLTSYPKQNIDTDIYDQEFFHELSSYYDGNEGVINSNPVFRQNYSNIKNLYK